MATRKIPLGEGILVNSSTKATDRAILSYNNWRATRADGSFNDFLKQQCQLLYHEDSCTSKWKCTDNYGVFLLIHNSCLEIPKGVGTDNIVVSPNNGYSREQQ